MKINPVFNKKMYICEKKMTIWHVFKLYSTDHETYTCCDQRCDQMHLERCNGKQSSAAECIYSADK